MWGDDKSPPPTLVSLVLMVALVAIGLSTCSPHRGKAHAHCAGSASKLTYFPVSGARVGKASDVDASAAVGMSTGLDNYRRNRYSRYLLAMGEPSLACETRFPVYRFMWLRSFHNPIAVRVEQHDDGMHLAAVELEGADSYEFGKQARRIERMLSIEEVHRFSEALAQAEIWTASVEQKQEGLDGARWIVEARDGKRYRLQDVWTPEHGRVHSLGKTFLALTGWSFPQDELY